MIDNHTERQASEHDPGPVWQRYYNLLGMIAKVSVSCCRYMIGFDKVIKPMTYHFMVGKYPYELICYEMYRDPDSTQQTAKTAYMAATRRPKAPKSPPLTHTRAPPA